MALDPKLRPRPPWGLIALVAAQTVCAVFFLSDVLNDWRDMGLSFATELHVSVEFLATLALCAAIVFETRYILRLLRRKEHLERSVSIASAAMRDVIEAHFEAWKLTPAEQDIATFLVKGMTIPEIAVLRGSAEGTIKSHLNAVYRKSGTQGRGDLLATILDSVMEAREEPAERHMAEAARTYAT
jgi:DNA-binding CsgD family transcriptional regulator